MLLYKEAPLKKRTIETARSSVDQKKVWVERLESEMDLIKKKNEQLETLVEAMANQLGATMNGGMKQGNFQNHQNALEMKDSGVQPISSNHLQTLNATHLSKGVERFQQADDWTEGTFNKAQSDTERQAQKKTITVSFKLEDLDHQKPKKSVDHYVPAGTFVKARLTSGVVASTAVGASSSRSPFIWK